MKAPKIPLNVRRILYFLFGVGIPLALLPFLSAATPRKLVAPSGGPAGPPRTQKVPAGHQVATLAGGCFWAMQTEFQMLKGVDSVVAGYSGGKTASPTYEAVCTGDTGHAETVNIVFDPKVLSYTDLLRIFLTDIDPTTLNRQGPDEGTQYRSAIFYRDAAQKAAAEAVIKEITAKKLYRNPIVTEVVAFKAFYPAEDYHQNYFTHNPDNPYCATVVTEEVRRFKKMNQARLKNGS